MLNVLSVVFPIFLVIFLGYLCVRRGLVSATTVGEMGRYVMYLALPAVIVKTLIGLPLDDLFNLRYLLAYLLTSASVMVMGYWLLSKNGAQTKLDSAVMVTGMVVPNSAFIGYPIMLQMMDSPLVSGFAMALIIENLCILPACFILMDYHAITTQTGLRQRLLGVAKRTVKNPLLIAIVIGVVGNVSSLPVPDVIHQALSLLAPSAVAVALFVIGGSLASVVVKETRWAPLSLTMVGKLIVQPLVALMLMSWLLPGEPELTMTLVVITAVPMLSIYAIIGEVYNRRTFCATAQLTTTAASLVTIPLVLSIAHWWLAAA
ncbi:AEC family transporter [Vibrio furnissii]|uniref:AEC family transporter n=1 Tax=Vibrio furnissii TaxID=29494 RepID=UPI0024BA1C68|nr:AEC family transporter [Vibrio furnissii]WHR52524.1 AEC family transporter [Vibrio furnissii]